jgi:hypothetical protein
LAERRIASTGIAGGKTGNNVAQGKPIATTSLRGIERHLVGHQQFGASTSIVARASSIYRLHLEAMAQQLVSAARLAHTVGAMPGERQQRVLNDPLVRHAIGMAATGPGRDSLPPLSPVELVLDAASEYLLGNRAHPPLESSVQPDFRITGKRHYAWLWNEGARDHVLCQRFETISNQVFATDLPNVSVKWITPDADGLTTLSSAVQLLRELIPCLWENSLPHIQCLIALDHERTGRADQSAAGLRSVSDAQIPGSIFLSSDLLSDATETAETMLHESLHHKLYDIWLARMMFRDPSQGDRTPVTIHAFWRSRDLPRDWPVRRALAAFHVYVHLGLFFAALEQRDRKRKLGDKASARVKGQTAIERAAYLGRELQRVGGAELGPEGHRFTTWLLDALAPLEADRR